MSGQDERLGEAAAGDGAHRAGPSDDHARLRAVFDGAPVAMVVVDGHDRVVEANEAACALVAADRRRLMAGALCEHVHPGDLDLVRRALAAAREGVRRRTHVEARVVTSSGDERVAAIDLVCLDPEAGRSTEILLQAVDVTAQRRLEAELRAEAELDPLTALQNRRSFERALAAHLAVTQRYGAAGALLLVDVDRFKAVNDTHGHVAGDEVLREVGRLLHGRLRGSDVVGRLGGDEFAVLLPLVPPSDVAAVAAAIVGEVREHTAVRTPVTVSVGAALISPGASVPEVFERADLALYTAKRRGRDRWELAP